MITFQACSNKYNMIEIKSLNSCRVFFNNGGYMIISEDILNNIIKYKGDENEF
jgi:hypothetical protein